MISAFSIFSRAKRGARGFTLLEVMISIGILGIALLAIGDLNGGAVRMHAYARQVTIATQLARGKMLDIQQQLQKDGLSDFSKEYHGSFEDDGEPDFKWKALVIKPEIDVDPQQIMTMVSAGLGVGGDGKNGQQGTTAGIANPLAAGGALSGVIDTQIKAMTEAIKQSVREVKLTISWKGAKGETESIDVVEHLVVLPNAAQNAAANATPLTPGANTGAPGTGTPGIPGLQQVPGMNNGMLNMPGVGAGGRAPIPGIGLPGGGWK